MIYVKCAECRDRVHIEDTQECEGCEAKLCHLCADYHECKPDTREEE